MAEAIHSCRRPRQSFVGVAGDPLRGMVPTVQQSIVLSCRPFLACCLCLALLLMPRPPLLLLLCPPVLSSCVRACVQQHKRMHVKRCCASCTTFTGRGVTVCTSCRVRLDEHKHQKDQAHRDDLLLLQHTKEKHLNPQARNKRNTAPSCSTSAGSTSTTRNRTDVKPSRENTALISDKRPPRTGRRPPVLS